MNKRNENALNEMRFAPLASIIIFRAGVRYCARKIGVSHSYVARWAKQGMPVRGGEDKWWVALSDIGSSFGINYSPEELKKDSEKKRTLIKIKC